jgi:hypothetical protein
MIHANDNFDILCITGLVLIEHQGSYAYMQQHRQLDVNGNLDYQFVGQMKA